MIKKSYLEGWEVPTFFDLSTNERFAVRTWAEWVLTESGSNASGITRAYFQKHDGSGGTSIFYQYRKNGFPAPSFRKIGRRRPPLEALENDYPGGLRVLLHPTWVLLQVPIHQDDVRRLISYLKPKVRQLFLAKPRKGARPRTSLLTAGTRELSSDKERLELIAKCAGLGGLDGLGGAMAVLRFSLGSSPFFYRCAYGLIKMGWEQFNPLAQSESKKALETSVLLYRHVLGLVDSFQDIDKLWKDEGHSLEKMQSVLQASGHSAYRALIAAAMQAK